MPKKVRPNRILNNDAGEIPASNAEQSSQIDSNISTVGMTLTEKMSKKLEQYDALEKSNSILVQQNQELQEKVEQYIEKMSATSNAAQNHNDLMKQIDDLKKQLEEKKDITSKKVESQMKRIQKEYDNALLKISELTFENAKLLSELQNMTKCLEQNGLSNNSKEFSPQLQKMSEHPSNIPLSKPNRAPYNPYLNNGYQSW